MTKKEVEEIDKVDNATIKVVYEDGNLIVSKEEYKVLADLLRKIECASVEAN